MNKQSWDHPDWMNRADYVLQRTKTMGLLRGRAHQAKETYRRVSIPPAPGQASAMIYAKSVQGGIIWVRDRNNPNVQVIRRPWDKEMDPDGTIHIIQWEGPEDD